MMSVFVAPSWDVDKASEDLSTDVFGTNKTKGRSKEKKNGTEKKFLKRNSDNSEPKEEGSQNPHAAGSNMLSKLKKRRKTEDKRSVQLNSSLDQSESKVEVSNTVNGKSPSKLKKGSAVQKIERFLIAKKKKSDRSNISEERAEGLNANGEKRQPKRQKMAKGKMESTKLNVLEKQSVRAGTSASESKAGISNRVNGDSLKKQKKGLMFRNVDGEPQAGSGKSMKLQKKASKLLKLQSTGTKSSILLTDSQTGVFNSVNKDNVKNPKNVQKKGNVSEKIQKIFKVNKNKKKANEASRRNVTKELKKGIKLNEVDKNQPENANEVVLSRSKKRKMRMIAKRASEGKLSKVNNTTETEGGTSNPSFDLSFSVEPEKLTFGKSDGTSLQKKQLGKKKGSTMDAVDGSKQYQLKKSVVANLLKTAPIPDQITLHELKKKRKQLRESSFSLKKGTEKPATLREKVTEQLKSARFRWLNEQLYTSNSADALQYFKEDPEAFGAYHSGYRNQVAQWPMNPVDVIAKSLSSFPKDTVVADFGCGDAKLAESLPNLKVHSLDLVAAKPGVIACDMAHSPLLMESVNVVVFCLSLMGNNLNDFILEANRVLKKGGLLKIAEVVSRFEDIEKFTKSLSKFGFQLKTQDVTKKMFIFMDFEKVKTASKSGKLPDLALEPCLYKKR